MRKLKYTDPYPSLPAYERNIIRLRAMELTLALFYAEQIKRTAIDLIRTSDRWRKRRDPHYPERVPEGAKEPFRKALDALVSDGALLESQKEEIAELTDFRNDIGHRIDHLFSDLEQPRFSAFNNDDEIKERLGIRKFDHAAVGKMHRVLKKLSGLSLEQGYVMTFRFDGYLMFSSAEKVLQSEIVRIRKNLQQQLEERQRSLEALNEDIKIGFRLLNDQLKKRFFSIRFERGPMTRRGEELCYLMLDRGIQPLAIAQIFEMKLPAIQRRVRIWKSMGGTDRPRINLESIPIQIARSRLDD